MGSQQQIVRCHQVDLGPCACAHAHCCPSTKQHFQGLCSLFRQYTQLARWHAERRCWKEPASPSPTDLPQTPQVYWLRFSGSGREVNALVLGPVRAGNSGRHCLDVLLFVFLLPDCLAQPWLRLAEGLLLLRDRDLFLPLSSSLLSLSIVVRRWSLRQRRLLLWLRPRRRSLTFVMAWPGMQWRGYLIHLLKKDTGLNFRI